MRIFNSENYYPTDLDAAKAIKIAKDTNKPVSIDCKRCRVIVDKNMTLKRFREEIRDMCQ